MTQIVIDFEGWCRIDADSVNLTDCQTDETKTAAEWIAERGNIDGLVLESLVQTMDDSIDLEYGTIDLTIEEDEDDEDVG